MDLQNLLKIEDGVLMMKEQQLGLAEIQVPDAVTVVGSYAFFNDETVESVMLPSSVEKIQKHAFCQCYKLKKIFIPKSVTEIEEDFIHRCGKQVEIFCEGEKQKGWINKIEKKIIEDRIITDDDNAFNFHRSSGGWRYTTVKRETRIRHCWNSDKLTVHYNVTKDEFLKK